MSPPPIWNNSPVDAHSTGGSGRRIFRHQAVERYFRDGEVSVIPRWMHPRTFVYLWLLLVALVLLGSVMIHAILPHLSSKALASPTTKISMEGNQA